MPKFSLIIPVYNVEKFLRRCLDSVINQTERDIEIIIVNDCSPDASELIIQEYLSSDSRIIYLKHEVNKRQGGARNTGLEKATGEYIWFIDSDDFVDVNACELLYSTAKLHELDCLVFNVNLVSSDMALLPKFIPIPSKLIKLKSPINGMRFLEDTYKFWYFSAWCFTFKKSILTIPFRENCIIEDADWSRITIAGAKQTLATNYSPYFYIKNETSTMNTSNLMLILQAMLSSINSLIKFNAEKNIPILTTIVLWNFLFCCKSFFTYKLTIVERKSLIADFQHTLNSSKRMNFSFLQQVSKQSLEIILTVLKLTAKHKPIDHFFQSIIKTIRRRKKHNK